MSRASGCRGGTPAVIGHGWPAFDSRDGIAHRADIRSGDALDYSTQAKPTHGKPAFSAHYFFALRMKDFPEYNQFEGLYIMGHSDMVKKLDSWHLFHALRIGQPRQRGLHQSSLLAFRTWLAIELADPECGLGYRQRGIQRRVMLLATVANNSQRSPCHHHDDALKARRPCAKCAKTRPAHLPRAARPAVGNTPCGRFCRPVGAGRDPFGSAARCGSRR